MEPAITEVRDGKKYVVVLENNPDVMNALGQKLGISDELVFYDVWSLDEPDLLAHIPRPALALLVIIPMTEAWQRERLAEDAAKPDPYPLSGAPDEPVLWFKQTIGHACGSIGLLHCAINEPVASFIRPGSTLDDLRTAARPLDMVSRAQMLYDSLEFEVAHQSVARMGETAPLSLDQAHRDAHHFVAFIKAGDGHLWELEGSRKGPLDRGALAEDEDVLSPRALDLGLRRVMRLVAEGGEGDLRFSCTALAPRSN